MDDDRATYNIGGGNIDDVTGQNNVGFGKDNLGYLVSGQDNNAFGNNSQISNSSGSYNTSFGNQTLNYHSSSDYNVAIGYQSLRGDNIGGTPSSDNNTAIGTFSLRLVDGGNSNTAIGYNSGNAITTGSNNVIIGSNTGSTITTSSNNIIISDGGGTSRIQVDSGGVVGIGVTPSPQSGGALSGSVETNGILRVRGANGRYFTSGDGLELSKFSMYSYDRDNGNYNTLNINDTITVEGAGNVGIGVTPSTVWSTSYNALQIGLGGSIYAHKSAGSAMRMAANVVYEGTAPNYDDKYLTTSTASKYEQDSGNHIWSTAASGTINTTIPWSERMRIDGTTGNTTITTTTNQGGLTITSATDNTTLRLINTATSGKDWRLYSTGGSSGLGAGKLFIKVGTTETSARLVSFVDDGSNINVGIGDILPTAKLQIHTETNAGGAEVAAFLVNNSSTIDTEVRLAFAANTNDDISTGRYSYISAKNTSGINGQDLVFATNATGASATPKLTISSGGDILLSSTEGKIGIKDSNSIYIGNFEGNNVGLRFIGVTNDIRPCTSSGDNQDNTVDLGDANARFKDFYLSGGVYLGGTAAANKLDAYEEGTYSPILTGATTAGSSPTGVGTYTVIGNVCHLNIRFSGVTVTGAGGAINISLPFSGKSGATGQTTSNFNTYNVSFTGTYKNSLYVSGGVLYGLSSVNGTTWADWAIVDASNIYWNLSITYLIN